MKTPQGGKRFVALSAAVALGLGGAMVTAPSMAATDAPTVGETAAAESAAPAEVTVEAPTELGEAIATTVAQEKIVANDIAAIGYNAEGAVVVQTVAGAGLTASSEELAPVAAFAEAEGQGDLVVTEIANGYSPVSSDEVVGGAGYINGTPEGVANGEGSLCSVGFPATGPDGEDVLLTAGHCGEKGDPVYLEKPSTAAATGAEKTTFLSDTQAGEFVESQFARTIVRPGDSADPKDYKPAEAQDFAVIKLTDDSLTTLPEVTDWTTAGDDDLAASTKPVAGVSDVTMDNIGDPIWRSGRTSGMKKGDGDGSESRDGVIGNIVDGYALVGHGEPKEDENGDEYFDEFALVYGFGANALALEGDSGGAVMMGDQAVGFASLSNLKDWMWVAELDKALEVYPEYTVNTAEPTETPKPTPTETKDPSDKPSTEAPDEDPALKVAPQEIAAEQFIAGDEDQAIAEDRGVTYTVTDVEPGSKVVFDTYAGADDAANAGTEAAPEADTADKPAKSITVTADEDGTASSRVWGLPTADASAYVGDYDVVVTTEDETLEGSFSVVAGDDNGDGGQDDGEDLPRTGSTTGPLVAGAAGLVALGGALVYVARRRKA